MMFKNSTIIFHCLKSPLGRENDVKLFHIFLYKSVDNRKLSLSICYLNDIEWNIFNTRREIWFLEGAMFCFIFITHQWNASLRTADLFLLVKGREATTGNTSAKLLFALKSVVYYVAIATVIFSHVKNKTCHFQLRRYHVSLPKAHLVFH